MAQPARTIQAFSARVRDENGALVVEIHGELDDATAPVLRDAIGKLLAQGRATLTLDLRNMTFIDSTGIGALVGALKRCRSAAGDVVLRGPSAATSRVLELTGLHSVFEVVDGR